MKPLANSKMLSHRFITTPLLLALQYRPLGEGGAHVVHDAQKTRVQIPAPPLPTMQTRMSYLTPQCLWVLICKMEKSSQGCCDG